MTRRAPSTILTVVLALLALACAPKTVVYKPGERWPPDGGALGGTTWQFAQFRGRGHEIVKPDNPSRYNVSFGANGRLAANIDCHRGEGTWTSAGRKDVELSPLALTRAACPPTPFTDRILEDWTNVRSFVIRGGRLYLTLADGAGTYELDSF